jgi:hypothetical protein
MTCSQKIAAIFGEIGGRGQGQFLLHLPSFPACWKQNVIGRQQPRSGDRKVAHGQRRDAAAA